MEKSNKDYIFEDDIHRINNILAGSDIEKMMQDDGFFSDNLIEDKAILEAMESVTSPGIITLRLDGLKMKLFLNLQAPLNSTNEITIIDIKNETEKLNEFCISQIDWNIVDDIYNRVMIDGEILTETIIARGKPVEYRIPEHIILRDDLHTDFKPLLSEYDKVDFHKIKSFLTVERGEIIGDLIPEYLGLDGVDLNGRVIKCPIKPVNYLKSGLNTVEKSGRVISEIDGALKIVNNQIIVDPILTIKSDIDYKTGDIKYNGDINIEKTVREGFAITCKRNLIVEDSIEPSNINCGNDIQVRNGIIGAEKYTTHCNGSISTKHIVNANVKCKGTVYVKNSIVGSHICSQDQIIIGHKGSLIGGDYHIQNGIITGNIGNELCVKTYIYAGVDFKIEERLKLTQDTIAELLTQMKSIQTRLTSCSTREDKEKMKYFYIALKDRVKSLNDYMRSLLLKLYKNENSSIKVHGKVYPGTFIDICHVKYGVKSIKKNVEFSLDKLKGEIKVEYLDS